MFVRLMVTLPQDEAAALDRMANSELRDPREQLRFILRQAAQARGLLPPPEEKTSECASAKASSTLALSGT